MSNKLVDDALPVMEMPNVEPEKTEAKQPLREPEPEAPRGAVNFDDNPTTIESVIDDVKDISPSEEAAPRQRREEVEEIPPLDGTEGACEVLEVKPIIEDVQIFKEPPPQQPPKRKKKASAKQLEHLAKAREKALATRKKKAAEKQKKNAVKTLQKEANMTTKESTQSIIMNLSPEQLQDLQEKAIEKYDTKRKARKKLKKEAIEEQKKAIHTNNVIHKAITQTDPDDMWSVCFQ